MDIPSVDHRDNCFGIKQTKSGHNMGRQVGREDCSRGNVARREGEGGQHLVPLLTSDLLPLVRYEYKGLLIVFGSSSLLYYAD